jgi:hypothetical protein
MKKVLTVLGLALGSLSLQAQDLDKQDQILIGKIPVAKLEKVKRPDLAGLVNDFNIKSVDGQTTIATIQWDEDIKQEDSSLDYWHILRANGDSCLIPLSKFGAAKGVAKLVGKNKLIANNAIDPTAWAAFRKGAGKKNVERTPRYTLTNRDKSWPIELDTDKGQGTKISQNGKEVATLQYVGEVKGNAVFIFTLPNGVKAATIEFAGGNNMQAFIAHTHKDNNKRNVPNAQKDKILAASGTKENPYFLATKRVAKWLVENGYI